ncbi:hypothetical protein PR048_002927 [Dryococelus australis]|uniref:Uncharacterized protein n=1 Tax=Dryococelus australis TaxID=614101 RepID=A0ABQ9INV9_9NEOP|nr:hypothetical protein PR048_002927 [Dryococelus australis]
MARAVSRSGSVVACGVDCPHSTTPASDIQRPWRHKPEGAPSVRGFSPSQCLMNVVWPGWPPARVFPSSCRLPLERASQKQPSDTHKTPYDRVKRCQERKLNIKASERVNVDVFTQNKWPINVVSEIDEFRHMERTQDSFKFCLVCSRMCASEVDMLARPDLAGGRASVEQDSSPVVTAVQENGQCVKIKMEVTREAAYIRRKRVRVSEVECVHKVVCKRLRLYAYKIQLLHEVKPTDKQARVEFAVCTLNKIEEGRVLHTKCNSLLMKRHSIRRRTDSVAATKSRHGSLRFFSWGHIENMLYAKKIRDVRYLRQRIIAAAEAIPPDMLARTWEEIEYRLDVCRATNGAHIAQVLSKNAQRAVQEPESPSTVYGEHPRGLLAALHRTPAGPGQADLFLEAAHLQSTFRHALPALFAEAASVGDAVVYQHDKIDVKQVYTEVDFAIGLQFIRHALDDSEPIADFQGDSSECYTARKDYKRGGGHFIPPTQRHIVAYIAEPTRPRWFITPRVEERGKGKDDQEILAATTQVIKSSRAGSGVSIPRSVCNPAFSSPVTGENGATSECEGGEKWEIPEKTRRPVASPSTIPTYENPGMTRPGIVEPGWPRWEASRVYESRESGRLCDELEEQQVAPEVTSERKICECEHQSSEECIW